MEDLEPKELDLSAPIMPTDRELQALKLLWESGPMSVREIGDALAEQGPQLAYTTVLSLLQVMEQKKLVGHKTQGKVYLYFARVQRETTFRRLATGFLDSVFDGAMDEYLLHALQARRVSAAELSRLEQMIDEARRKTRRGGGSSRKEASNDGPDGAKPDSGDIP